MFSFAYNAGRYLTLIKPGFYLIINQLNENATTLTRFGKRVLGVDVARHGDDLTVLTYRYGPIVKHQQHYQGKRVDEVANIVARAMKAERIDCAVIDTIGLGAGVMDVLIGKGLGHRVEGFNANERAHDPTLYENRKAEVAFMIRKMIEHGEIGAVVTDDLKSDLMSYDYTITKKERYKVEDPEGKSPDFGDSMLMAFSMDDVDSAYIPGMDEDEEEELEAPTNKIALMRTGRVEVDPFSQPKRRKGILEEIANGDGKSEYFRKKYLTH